MTRRTVVTAGPSITAAQVRDLLPGAEPVPPIRFGDSYSYRLGAGDRLVVVDGLFWQVASVRHRELLDLIDQGVLVYGCSSMGALRAAELTDFGMLGFGQVFAAYRTGAIVGDDEVGMVHGLPEDGYTVGVDALVNVRATLDRAVEEGRLDPAGRTGILTVATKQCFTDRSWGSLVRAADTATHSRDLLSWVRARPVDVKYDDAAGLLRLLASHDAPAPAVCSPHNAAQPAPAPGESGYSAAWAWNRRPRVTGTDGVPASLGDVLELAAVTDPDYAPWRHEKVRRVIAADELSAGRGPGARRGRAPRIPAQRAPTTEVRPEGVDEATWAAWMQRERILAEAGQPDESDLDLLLVAHLRRHGVITEGEALPGDVAEPWLHHDERVLPEAARTALVVTRSAAADRNSQLDRTLVVDLARAGRMPELATTATRIRREFEASYDRYTGHLSPAGTALVEDRLGTYWGREMRTELRARGFRGLPEIAIMFALVDLG